MAPWQSADLAHAVRTLGSSPEAQQTQTKLTWVSQELQGRVPALATERPGLLKATPLFSVFLSYTVTHMRHAD